VTGILAISVTAAGAEVCRRLPYEHQHGDLVATVRRRWHDVEGFVLVCATGVAVRAIAPLLGGKTEDPFVVCIDDRARWAIALTGGHRAGANDVAHEAAALLGAEAVVTTATDGAGIPALDAIPGFMADGDVAGVTRRWLDGEAPAAVVDADLETWPLPEQLVKADEGPVLVTDRAVAAVASQVVLRPRSLVLGVGATSQADADRLRCLFTDAMAAHGLHPEAVGVVATVDRRAGDPAVVALASWLGVPVRACTPGELSTLDVPNPSAIVADAVGTPSVAEAAALLAAGPSARLVVEKQRSEDSTVAVARRRCPSGRLAVVGLGPGDPLQRTSAATAAVRHADVVIGYGPYVDLAGDIVTARQQIIRSPIGAEAERCRTALSLAASGRTVALVCSGDPGVYAMASLVLELAPGMGAPPVTIVPGVTAALAGAAVLGAPLGHDHAAVSLSDLLTPWSVIERRLRAVADADFTVSLYNPRSAQRTHQLPAALALLAAHRPPGTPAAVLTDIGRSSQVIERTTLARLDPDQVDMRSLVIIGSSTTRWIGERMVTPRGYEP
jgi:cobalt-precorrin 5A hydrolase/precorrin-3B C17-methyltransferase